MKMKHQFAVTALIVSLFSLPLTAKGPNQLLSVTLDTESLLLQPQDEFKSYTVTLSGPSGTFTYTFNGNEHGLIDLLTPEGVVFADGLYKYEIMATPHAPKQHARGSFVSKRDTLQSGTFSIKEGTMVMPEVEDSIRQALVEGFSDADDGHDQVILDDLIVDGSLCVGFDCVNGESFSFDTIRLKENNLRIKFQDTSSTASFPSRDWQLTANASANGGANKFSIDDIDGGRTPFTVEAGAPSNSLYVDDGGRLGLGTSIPVADIHIIDGDTPTVRLEQNGSSGFAPQTWDLAGNETSFFIRDATNGSALPFRVRPGATSQALVIAEDGNIGIGDLSPDARLDVESGDIKVSDGSIDINDTTLRTAADAGNPASLKIAYTGDNANTHQSLRMFSTGQVNASFTDTVQNVTWRLAMFGGTGSNDDNFQITRAGVGFIPFRIDNNGNGEFNGTVTANGVLLTSDVNAKTDFEAVDSQAVLNKVLNLPISEWRFKKNEARHLGPMAQDFHNAFGLGDSDVHINMTDGMGVALSAIQGLHQQNQDAQTRMLDEQARFMAIIDTLQKRVAELEAKLAQ